jgi:endonuclease/exonuclease/phosphatase family metal-dependent hydrolase
MAVDARETGVQDVSAGRPRRRWVSVLVWVLVAPFAVWAVLRLVPADVHFRWVQLVGFTPYVAVASVVPVLVALVARRWAALAVGVLVAAVFAACVVPRMIPDGGPAASGPSLRVLSSNLAEGSVPASALVGLVRELRPDVLALQELTPKEVAALDEAGLGRLLPYKTDRSRPGVGGSGIFARFPVTPGQEIFLGNFGQARATVKVPGAGPVEVVSVHPCAPRYDYKYQCWGDGLAALPAPGKAARILAGDFNATLDHARVRALLDEGYRDAADATGNGLGTTWPYKGWHFNGVPMPRVTLDHIMVTPGGTVRAFDIHRLPATDHRAVFAELTLPKTP